jgi:hypothetical protein
MVETIQFDTVENKLIVTLYDGTVQVYTDAASYLAVYPDREADVVAMGWV